MEEFSCNYATYVCESLLPIDKGQSKAEISLYIRVINLEMFLHLFKKSLHCLFVFIMSVLFYCPFLCAFLFMLVSVYLLLWRSLQYLLFFLIEVRVFLYVFCMFVIFLYWNFLFCHYFLKKTGQTIKLIETISEKSYPSYIN